MHNFHWVSYEPPCVFAIPWNYLEMPYLESIFINKIPWCKVIDFISFIE